MSFDQFPFHPKVAAGITACGYSTPTPIQVQAIPPLLAGHDLIGLAQTGTGKTAAFALPILHKLTAGPRGRIRALVIAPTRELAQQIHDNFEALGRGTGLRCMAIYGGVSKHAQTVKLRAGVEIVVACPGRLLDHLSERAVNLSQVEMLVLDEADQMFDMGFLPNIRRIIQMLPTKRQNLMFSATMPDEIRGLTKEILREPVTVQVGHERPPDAISHVLYPVEQPLKTVLLKTLIARPEMETTMVFTRTKHRAKNLARQLLAAGFPATSLQGNLSQQKRREALDGFKSGKFRILVATDIAARGIDVAGVTHVVNFDMPDTAEAYTHRIGRTGRASRTGEALTFATGEDRRMIVSIERILGRKMDREAVPSGLADQAPSVHDEPMLEENRPRRDARPERPKRGPARQPKSPAFGMARPAGNQKGAGSRQPAAPGGNNGRRQGHGDQGAFRGPKNRPARKPSTAWWHRSPGE